MAKLTTPHLKDVAPTLTGLSALPDRLISVGAQSDPQGVVAARILVMGESGDTEAALTLSVSRDPNGTPFFSDLSVSLTGNAGPEVTGRLNRLLNGFTIERPGTASTVTRKSQAPKFGKYWRTGKVSMFHAGRVLDAPGVAEGKPKFLANGTMTTLWSLRSGPVSQPDLTGFTPVSPVTPARPKRAARSAQTAPKPAVPAPSALPTIRQAVAASAPPSVEVNEATEQTPSVTPKGSQKFGGMKLPTPKAPTVSPSAHPTHPNLFQMPSNGIPTLHVDKVVKDDLEEAMAAFAKGDPVKVLMRGPSGAGKTLAAFTLSKQHGLPFRKFDVAGMRDFGDWTGTVTLKASPTGVVTDFSPSEFAEAIMADGPYGGVPRVVLLDEVTRAETAGSQNALMSILDGHGTLYVPDARKSIQIDPAVMFIFTANIGAAFSGTIRLDEALANRITHWVVCDYPSEPEEAKVLVEQSKIAPAMAVKLVKVAKQLRAMADRREIESSISTRQLIEVGRRIANGRLPHDAFRVSFIQRLSPEGAGNSDVVKVTTAVNSNIPNTL